MRLFLILITSLFILNACAGVAAAPDLNSSPDASNGGGEAATGDTQGLSCRAKGFNYACWYNGCYQEEEIPASLAAAKALGSNWIEIVPTWYQDDKAANQIYEHPQKSATFDDLRTVVPLARGQGLQIALKPHIDLMDGDWRGTIDPSDLPAWQTSYESFILGFAGLAQSLGVEVLSIGTELKTRSGDVAFWRQLLPKIRAVYSGFLTYSANWDEYDQVAFWDLLDFVGIDFYFPLTNDPNANQGDMEEALADIGSDLEKFSQEKDRPFLFTEIGYRSVDGTNTKPYDYGMSGGVDEEEQADAYAAVLETFKDEDWLQGIFWWRLDTRLDHDDDGYAIYGKIAGDVLKTFWGGEICAD